jgi:hypothetical protein
LMAFSVKRSNMACFYHLLRAGTADSSIENLSGCLQSTAGRIRDFRTSDVIPASVGSDREDAHFALLFCIQRVKNHPDGKLLTRNQMQVKHFLGAEESQNWGRIANHETESASGVG